MKTTGLSLIICLVSLVSLGCQGQSLFGPSAEDLAWQALIAEYDVLAEKGGGIECNLQRRIYVTPIAAPELEAAFPDTAFFRGGARRRCVDKSLFNNLTSHSLVAVRGDQTYLMHIYADWSSGASAVNDDNFRGFNRLLKDSGQTVTPENEIVIARAAVVMMLFYDYHSSFDSVHFASPEDAAPADYRLGVAEKIDEANKLLGLPIGGQQFTVAIPTWTVEDGRVSRRRVAFRDGQLSYLDGQCYFLNVKATDFEAWGLDQPPSTETCEKGPGIRVFPVDD